MAACPLCILGLTEEEHTKERWMSITDEEKEIIRYHWFRNPGVISEETHSD